MKKIAISISMVALLFTFATEARGGHGGGHSNGSRSGGGTTHVSGYRNSKGTYVAPHRRTSPNHTKEDNWSHKGNVNPDTGEVGTKE